MGPGETKVSKKKQAKNLKTSKISQELSSSEEELLGSERLRFGTHAEVVGSRHTNTLAVVIIMHVIIVKKNGSFPSIFDLSFLILRISIK